MVARMKTDELKVGQLVVVGGELRVFLGWIDSLDVERHPDDPDGCRYWWCDKGGIHTGADITGISDTVLKTIDRDDVNIFYHPFTCESVLILNYSEKK
jgi:hypothetical protein